MKTNDRFAKQRQKLVAKIQRRGIRVDAVLKAMFFDRALHPGR